jgi:VCBS repeat-containing protein
MDIDGDPLTAMLFTAPSNGVLTLNGDGSFSYQPNTNFNGTDSFTYNVSDGTTSSSPATVTITISPVNDAPSFSKGPDQTVNRYSGPQTVSNWATGISSGPVDEAGQALVFLVSNDNPVLFSTQPSISPSGALSYTPDTNGAGSATVTVILKDDGGTANGGVDSSAPQTFLITVNASNQPPTVSIISPTNGSTFVVSQSITIVADAVDSDGFITAVDFFEATNHLAQATNAPYYVTWTNAAAGGYQLQATAADDQGASATSSVVNITVLLHPPLLVTGPMILNRQTGLFEQTVRVINPTPVAFGAVAVIISNLTSGTRVYNASGQTNGLPFVQYNSLVAAGDGVDLTLEYYATNRVQPNPTLLAELVSPSPPLDPAGQQLAIDRALMLTNGTFLIDFSTLSNRTYYIQYSADMQSWNTAFPGILGTGSRLQWIDNGPPKTGSHPGSQPNRSYRLLLLP